MIDIGHTKSDKRGNRIMAEENTFIMLKPDCMKRGIVGEIITRIERKGTGLLTPG
jgi:hypothetical protein